MRRSVLVLGAIFCFCVHAETPAEQAAWHTLTMGVTDSNPNKRKAAVAGLEAGGNHPKLVAMAETALLDKDVDVRQTAAAVLGSVKAQSAIPKLTAALDDDAPEVSFSAARSLWLLGDRMGLEILTEVLQGERSDSSGLVKSSLREAKHTLKNPSALTRIGIREGAGAFLGPFGMGFMVYDELRKDGSSSARVLSAVSLGTDKDPKTIAPLEGALSDKNWVVRAAAAKALGERNSKASIPKVASLLESDSDQARFAAAAVVIRLSAPMPVAPKRAPARVRPAVVNPPPAAVKPPVAVK
jgi:HEAT repeat protein